MSRAEIYPWSLLTEVGDYFCVPESFKPYSYMSLLVSQKNYRMKGITKYTCEKTSYGTIVMLAQIGDEIPPYEFQSEEGILSISSRKVGLQPPSRLTVGDAPVRPKRTQVQMISMMPPAKRNANLPWWYDAEGNFVTNPGVITEEDENKYVILGETPPGPEDPYPEYYGLDENLERRTKSMEEWEEEPVITGDFEHTEGEDEGSSG